MKKLLNKLNLVVTAISKVKEEKMINNIIKNIEKHMLNNKWILFFAFFILLKPLSFYYFNILNQICNILMFGIIAVIGVIYISKIIKDKKIPNIQIYIIAFMMSLFISTILGTKDFSFFFKVYVKWFAISIYVEMLIKNDLKFFLKTFSIYIFSIILINFASIVLFPNGFMQANGVSIYFLGNDNTSTINLILGTLFIILKDYFFYKKMSKISVISILAVTISYIITWSATGIVAVVMMLAFLIFLYKRNKWTKIFNIKTYIAIAIVIFLAIVVFRLQNHFEYIIVGMLKKDLTFSQRVFIWDRCLNYIAQSPILGLGVQEYSARLFAINIYHAHCTFLNVVLEGGIIGIIFYINIFIQIIRNLEKHKNSEFTNILSVGFFIFFICGIVEVFQDSQLMYIFIIMSYYVDKIIKEADNVKIEEVQNEKDSCSNKWWITNTISKRWGGRNSN